MGRTFPLVLKMMGLYASTLKGRSNNHDSNSIYCSSRRDRWRNECHWRTGRAIWDLYRGVRSSSGLLIRVSDKRFRGIAYFDMVNLSVSATTSVSSWNDLVAKSDARWFGICCIFMASYVWMIVSLLAYFSSRKLITFGYETTQWRMWVISNFFGLASRT